MQFLLTTFVTTAWNKTVLPPVILGNHLKTDLSLPYLEKTVFTIQFCLARTWTKRLQFLIHRGCDNTKRLQIWITSIYISKKQVYSLYETMSCAVISFNIYWQTISFERFEIIFCNNFCYTWKPLAIKHVLRNHWWHYKFWNCMALICYDHQYAKQS